jgi:Tol biopolymer transport system component
LRHTTTPLALAAALIVVSTAHLAAPAPADAQIFFGYFGKNKISYETFDWQIYHSPHFDVYYYEAEEHLLPKIVSFAESAYDRLSRRLDFQIDEPTPLIVYATHSAFEQNNILLNFVPEGVGAFATPVRFRMVMPADLPDPKLFELIMHELTHIFEYHILFQGSLSRAVAQQPPTWMMEGFASYMADDEESWEKMFLRDAVVNDLIPPISRVNFGGYMAYRFGHAFFDFVEERWGEDGVQDFIYELRNTIGARADRAVERAFRIEPEEFDIEFRRWLRERYLPQLVASGEPLDYGRPYRIENKPDTQETSPVPSPSGDLVAAFSTAEGEVDVVLFDNRRRRSLRNLTSGFSNDFQYLASQGLQVTRRMGNDISFSADGDTLAVFVKRESGRSLMLLDVISGKIVRIIDMDHLGLEQQLSPDFSPDGSHVAFAAWQDGDFDLFLYDLETGELDNVTDDELYNGGPDFSPDGGRLVFTSVIEGYEKLFEIDLETRERRQLSFGQSHERDASFSPDGRRIYFTSDRTGAENVYSVDVETGRVSQHTNAVTGCYQPEAFIDEDGEEQLVFVGFWRQRQRLYLADPDEVLTGPDIVPPGGPAPAYGDDRTATAARGGDDPAEGAPDHTEPFVVIGGEAAETEALPLFEPDIDVAIDMANRERYPRLKLHLEDAQTIVAVDDDQTVLGQIFLRFTDQIGDRQLFTLFTSVRSFSDFEALYLDTSRRTNWMIRLYDDRDYFVRLAPDGEILRDARYAETGLMGYLVYPFDFYRRVEVGLGARYRDVPSPLFARRGEEGNTEIVQVYDARSDAFPVAEVSFVSDTTLFANYGPISGHRYRVTANYAPDLEESGTLSRDIIVDARKYFPLTRRSNLAFRAWGATSEGNFTRPFFFGGLDTVRGTRIYSLVGDQAFYANAELRFPLIDVIALPFFNITNIRGVFFLDVGGAYFKDIEEFDFWDSDEDRLQDGISSYGIGLSADLFGLPLNFEFSKEWDLQDTISNGFETTLWIGQRF